MAQQAARRPWLDWDGMAEVGLLRLLTVTYVATTRELVAGFLAATVVVSSLIIPTVSSPSTLFAWAAMLGLLLLSRSRPSPLAIITTVAIVGSMLVAIVVNPTGQTVSLALATAPWTALLWARVRWERVLTWLVPVGLVNAGWIAFESLWGDATRAAGLTYSPNLSAGLLAALVVLLIHRRQPAWTWVPMLAAVPLTGCRWASLVLALTLTGMAVGRAMPWKHYLAVVAVSAAVLYLRPPILAEAYHTSVLVPSVMTTEIVRELRVRWPTTAIPSWTPQGWRGWEYMPHATPWRIATEAGIGPATLWVLLGATSVLQRPSRGRVARLQWPLVALLLLGAAENYIWLGALAPLYWLTVANPQPSRA